MLIHTMCDIETLATTHKALVLSIGLINFDPYGHDTWDTLNGISIYMDQSDQNHRYIDPSTVIWWINQSEEAKHCFTALPRHSVTNAKTLFDNYTKDSEALWGNGSNFDNAILRSLWSSEFNFHYTADMDMRTLRKTTKALRPNLTGIHKPEGFIKHNALHDARLQALQVQNWHRALSLKAFENAQSLPQEKAKPKSEHAPASSDFGSLL